MKKRVMYLVVSILVVAGLLLGILGCAAPAPKPTTAPPPSPVPAKPQVIKWNMQDSYELASSFSKNFAIEWAEWVKDITGGRLIIEVHPPGTFAKSGAILDALKKGTFQVALEFAGYYPETVFISQVETGLPMAWNDGFQAHDAFYNRGLWELVRDAYAKFNVMPLGVAFEAASWYNVSTKFPLKTLDDIKGKKIRATGIYGKYIEALGGIPTVVSSSDLYMSLKTGIIDGMIQGISTLDTLKLREVITHYITEPTLTPLVTSAPWVNKDAYNALPDDIKRLLDQTKYYNIWAAYKYKQDSWKTVVTDEKAYGLTWVKLSPADEKRARDICIKLWDDVAKLSPEAAKAVDIVKLQMRDWGR